MAQGGEEGAGALSLDDHVRDIFRFALYLTGHVQDAEDVTQNVCMRFLKYQKSFDASRGSMSAYLRRLTVNESNKILSARKRHYDVAELSVPPGTAPRGARAAEERDSANAILSLLDRLTGREREIFVMREVMEMGYPEIAEILSISPVTVRRFYSLARKRLKNLIRETVPELLPEGEV